MGGRGCPGTQVLEILGRPGESQDQVLFFTHLIWHLTSFFMRLSGEELRFSYSREAVRASWDAWPVSVLLPYLGVAWNLLSLRGAVSYCLISSQALLPADTAVDLLCARCRRGSWNTRKLRATFSSRVTKSLSGVGMLSGFVPCVSPQTAGRVQASKQMLFEG